MIRDYESRLQLLSKEIERLNEVLRRKVDESSQLSKKVSEYEYEFQKLDLVNRENVDLKERTRELEDFRRRAAEYENRIQILTA